MSAAEIEPARLTREAAEKLTDRLRLAAASIDEKLTKLYALIDQARAGEAHVALGYESWPAYVADVLEPIRLNLDRRRALVGKLSDEGMSTRAIAAVVGVDQSTVSRDRRAGDAPASRPTLAPVVGLDGKSYPRQTKPPKPVKRRPLHDDARVVADAAETLHRGLGKLRADDRYKSHVRGDKLGQRLPYAARALYVELRELLQDLGVDLDEIDEPERGER